MLQKWKTISEKTVFSADPFVKVVQQKIQTDRGHIIDDFYQVHLRPFVISIPFLENGSVLTLWQYKHGVQKVSLTFPGGFVEDGETPENACARELLEETGLQALQTTHLGEFTDNGNQRGCIGNYYLQTGCRFIGEPSSPDLEQTQLREMQVDDIDKSLVNGQIAITHHAAAWALARLHGQVQN